MTCRHTLMNQHDALYKVAREYPGGIEALAGRMGMAISTLRNKLSPRIDTNYVSFEEATLIVEYCMQAGVKEAELPFLAVMPRLGMGMFSLPSTDDVSEAGLSQIVCKAMADVGTVAATVSAAMADDLITAAEADAIEKSFSMVLKSVGEWRARVQLSREK